MLKWSTAGEGPRLGLILHHDDAEREYAYDRESHVGKLDKALDAAAEEGWTVVSLKSDWKRVVPVEPLEYEKSKGMVEVDMLSLYEVPFWVNAVMLVIPLFIAKEIGFRTGLRRRSQKGDAAKSTRGDVTLGSMLDLLGLMLSFTYAFSLRGRQ